MSRPILTVLALAMIAGIVALATSGTKEEAPDVADSQAKTRTGTGGVPVPDQRVVLEQGAAVAEAGSDSAGSGEFRATRPAPRPQAGAAVRPPLVIPQPFSPDTDPVLARMLDGLTLERIEEGEFWDVARSGEGQRALALAARMRPEGHEVFESYNEAVEAYWLNRLRTQGRNQAERELRVSPIQSIDPQTRTFVPLAALPR